MHPAEKSPNDADDMLPESDPLQFIGEDSTKQRQEAGGLVATSEPMVKFEVSRGEPIAKLDLLNLKHDKTLII